MGNVYATGSFTGSDDFGVGLMTAVGNLDCFVAKFNSNGVCQWSKRLNGPGTAEDQGLGIATNGTSVYIGGVYQTSLSIDGATAIVGYGGIDGFGAKFDAATGATQWATVFGSGSTDAVQAMCIDTAGNMYVTGYFSSSATYPTATFGSFTRSTNGGTGTDAYVAKLDGTAGTISWVSNGGMSGYNDNVSNSEIAYVPDQNAVVMVGILQAPSAGTTVNYATTSPASAVSLTFQGGLDIVVLELNAATGQFRNALSVAGASSSNEEALSATYDAASKYVCFTGYFNTSSLTFGSTPTIAPIGSDDIFYAAYDPVTNAFVWAKSAGSTIQDRGQSIGASGAGGVVITGRYRNTMTAPTASTPLTIVSSRTSSADEIYLLRVNSMTGNAELLLTPQGTSTITTGDIGTGVTAGKKGNTWLGGMFGGTTNFLSLDPLTTSGGTTADVLLVRYDEPYSLPVRLLSFSAQPDNNEVKLAWKTTSEFNNNYFEVERSTDGSKFISIGRYAAQNSSRDASYASIDGLSSLQPGFKPIFYRLKMVSESGEIQYSSVIAVYFNRESQLVTSLLPNPFSEVLTINLNVPNEGDGIFTVSDLNGRALSSRHVRLPKGFTTVTLSETQLLKRGTYIIKIDYDGKQIVNKVIKQ